MRAEREREREGELDGVDRESRGMKLDAYFESSTAKSSPLSIGGP